MGIFCYASFYNIFSREQVKSEVNRRTVVILSCSKSFLAQMTISVQSKPLAPKSPLGLFPVMCRKLRQPAYVRISDQNRRNFFRVLMPCAPHTLIFDNKSSTFSPFPHVLFSLSVDPPLFSGKKRPFSRSYQSDNVFVNKPEQEKGGEVC